MREETLPSLRQIHEALESASVDLYGFAVICQGGAVLIAEPVILDCLLLGLENFWFTHDESGRLSHAEFREEFFRHIWMKAKERAASSPARVSSELPLGHEAMVFYQLPQMARAALYLRTKKRFSYSSLSLIFGVSEGAVRTEVERAREFLLGRRLRLMEWSEEDF